MSKIPSRVVFFGHNWLNTLEPPEQQRKLKEKRRRQEKEAWVEKVKSGPSEKNDYF